MGAGKRVGFMFEVCAEHYFFMRSLWNAYEMGWAEFPNAAVIVLPVYPARQTQVKNVKLVSFGGERVEGMVKSLREGGFGFIRPLGKTEDVYFRISDTCK